jgi:hypothetical protein
MALAGSIGFTESYGELEMRGVPLKDVEYAIAALRDVCTETEGQQMKNGDAEEEGEGMDNMEEYLEDNYGHCRIPSKLLANFCASHNNWRRIDLNIGKFFAAFAHDLPLGKVGKGLLDPEGTQQFIGMMAKIFLLDHSDTDL